MTQEQVTKLGTAWSALAAYYRTKVSDEVLWMYADDLSDLDYQAVCRAMDQYRKNPKNRFLPMPADIRAMLEPQVDPEAVAREIAARVAGAIVKFGWCNRAAASAFIGPIGWSIVERQGGWQYLCEHHGVSIDPSSFQAQVREQAKAQLQYGEQAMNDHVQLPPGMAPAGEIISNLLGGSTK